jgi:cbb3-type cytochrome oxidase maturation protein
MTVIYVVFGLGLLVVGGAVAAFAWAARTGQFDDLDTPPLRATFDDD